MNTTIFSRIGGSYLEGARALRNSLRSGELFFQLSLASSMLGIVAAGTGFYVGSMPLFDSSGIFFVATPLFWLLGLDRWRKAHRGTFLPPYAGAVAVVFLGAIADAIAYSVTFTKYYIPTPAFTSGFPFTTRFPLGEGGLLSMDTFFPPLGNIIFWVLLVWAGWAMILRWRRWVKGV